MSGAVKNAWYTDFGRGSSEPVRLVCFPFSGGGAGVYRRWAGQIAGCEVVALKLPGREARYEEPAIGDMEVLINALAPATQELLDRPCVFFGHSMGALIAFELARELSRRFGSVPSRLIVSGFRSPERKTVKQPLHALDDASFIAELREYGQTLDEVLCNKQMMDALLPMLRADFRLHEIYRFQHDDLLSCAISAFHGIADVHASTEQMEGWRAHTSGTFNMTAFPGGHFFPFESANAEVHSTIENLVRRAHVECAVH